MGGRVKDLEEKRRAIGERLVEVGDIRQGSLYERSLKCGKSGCRCSSDKSYLHGPHYFLTKKVEGKTVQRTIPKGAVESTKAQIAKFQQFRSISQEFLAVNEEICEEKLKEPGTEIDRAQKKTSRRSLKPKS
jgi:hypothetical protein